MLLLSQGFTLGITNKQNYVNNLNNLNHLKWHKTEPNGDGTAAYYNFSGVYDTTKTQNHTVVCVQKVACEYLTDLVITSFD